jgi:uncharacterized protein (DUF2384 family)
LAQAISVPIVTLARRKKTGRFNLEESDRLLRIGRLVSQSQTLFRSPSRETTWFAKPARALGGKPHSSTPGQKLALERLKHCSSGCWTVVPVEFNLILNIEHPNFDKLEFGEGQEFIFDPRLKT